MLVIYDKNGTIIKENTVSTDIVGSLNYLDVIMQEGKILNRIDTSVTPNVPIFVDIPKTEIEVLKEYIKDITTLLINKDLEHDLKIKDLIYKVEKIDSYVRENIQAKGSVI